MRTPTISRRTFFSNEESRTADSSQIEFTLFEYSLNGLFDWLLGGATANSESVVADQHCGGRLFRTGLMRRRHTDRSTALIE
jgi:hypothetical protein